MIHLVNRLFQDMYVVTPGNPLQMPAWRSWWASSRTEAGRRTTKRTGRRRTRMGFRTGKEGRWPQLLCWWWFPGWGAFPALCGSSLMVRGRSPFVRRRSTFGRRRWGGRGQTGHGRGQQEDTYMFSTLWTVQWQWGTEGAPMSRQQNIKREKSARDLGWT
jgi:hypothetical protein